MERSAPPQTPRMNVNSASSGLRPLRPADHAAWARLWHDNLAHFGADEAATAAMDEIWRRLMDPGEPLSGWLIVLDGRPAGLAHVVLRYHTFGERPVAILEDLWIAPFARRRGLARDALDTLAQEGRRRGWRRIEWETDAANTAAQRLYERLAAPVAVRRYHIELG